MTGITNITFITLYPLECIFQTPHGYGTHFATSKAKSELRKWILTYHKNHLGLHEIFEISEPNKLVSFQHLIDFITLVRISKGTLEILFESYGYEVPEYLKGMSQ